LPRSAHMPVLLAVAGAGFRARDALGR
jgi:hypothetical protein